MLLFAECHSHASISVLPSLASAILQSCPLVQLHPFLTSEQLGPPVTSVQLSAALSISDLWPARSSGVAGAVLFTVRACSLSVLWLNRSVCIALTFVCLRCNDSIRWEWHSSRNHITVKCVLITYLCENAVNTQTGVGKCCWSWCLFVLQLLPMPCNASLLTWQPEFHCFASKLESWENRTRFAIRFPRWSNIITTARPLLGLYCYFRVIKSHNATCLLRLRSWSHSLFLLQSNLPEMYACIFVIDSIKMNRRNVFFHVGTCGLCSPYLSALFPLSLLLLLFLSLIILPSKVTLCVQLKSPSHTSSLHHSSAKTNLDKQANAYNLNFVSYFGNFHCNTSNKVSE